MADTGYPKSKRQSICLILFFNLIQFLFVKMNFGKKKKKHSEHINELQILPVIYIKERKKKKKNTRGLITVKRS